MTEPCTTMNICTCNLSEFTSDSSILQYTQSTPDNTDNVFLEKIITDLETYYYDYYLEECNQSLDKLNPQLLTTMLVDKYNYNSFNTYGTDTYQLFSDEKELAKYVMESIMKSGCVLDLESNTITELLVRTITFEVDDDCVSLPLSNDDIKIYVSCVNSSDLTVFYNDLAELFDNNKVMLVDIFFLNSAGNIITYTSDGTEYLYMKRLNMYKKGICKFNLTSACLETTAPSASNTLNTPSESKLAQFSNLKYSNIKNCDLISNNTLFSKHNSDIFSSSPLF